MHYLQDLQNSALLKYLLEIYMRSTNIELFDVNDDRKKRFMLDEMPYKICHFLE